MLPQGMQPMPPVPPARDVEVVRAEIEQELAVLAQAAQPAPPVPPVPPTAGVMPPPQPMNWYAAGKGSYLGIGVQELNPESARKLKIAEPHGVQVTHVGEDSPAAKAGVQEEDVVLEFNGQRVEGVEQFVRLVRETPPGRTVKLLINRGGNTKTLSATVGDRKAFMHMDPKFAEDMSKMGEEMKHQFGPDSKFQQDMQKEFGPDSKFRHEMEGQFGPDSQFQHDMQKLKDDMQKMHWDWQMHGPDNADESHGRGPRLGVETEPVGSQLGEFFGVKQGVLVRSVAEGSAAAKAGIKAGDVIVKIGSGEVGSPGQITNLLREAGPGKPVPVTVVRNRQEMTLQVTPGGGKPGR
jgi:membrane-associated protease RseP (regulator of RpoE activity)